MSTSTIYCVAAAVIALLTTDSVAQSGTPVKVVGSLDLSGPVADVGRDTLVGIQFAIDTLNKKGGLLGHRVAFEYQDNGTNPQRAVNQATALVQQGAALLMSAQASGGALAVSKLVSAKLKIPMCVSISGTDDLTMKEFQPYVFSVTPNSWFQIKGIATGLAKQPYKRYGLIAPDYLGGRASADRFKEFIKQHNPGAEIVVEDYPKLGAVDFTSTINKLLAAQPDYVVSILFGNDLMTFAKQGKAVGFFEKIGNRHAALYTESTLKAMGEDAPIGSEGWQWAPIGPMLQGSGAPKTFVTQFKAAKGDYPSDGTTQAYDCIMVWAQAVQAAKSFEPDAVMKALEAGEFATNRGTLRFGKLDHQADAPLYIGKLKMDKEFKRAVLDIVERVPGGMLRPSDQALMEARKTN